MVRGLRRSHSDSMADADGGAPVLRQFRRLTPCPVIENATPGLRLTYQPGQNKVIAEAAPSAIIYEGSCPRGT